jgi:cytidylate kinase
MMRFTKRVLPLPAGFPLTDAAAFAFTYGTSHHALMDRAALQPGETVLVLGAAGGVVMDGRDVGSVVLPNAELKLFITCDPAVRAQRRFNEMVQKNPAVTLAEIQQNLAERDYIDTHRALDPLIQVDDAVLIDNTNLTPTQQLELALNLVRERQLS